MTKAQTTAPSTAQNASPGFDSCSFDSHYDVIVIGAGLAGLAAAYQLRDRHILVLEQAVAPGGRVLTRTHDTIAYDLGAVFGYPLNTIPFAFQPAPLIKESTRVGLYVDGQLHLGDSVLACLQPLDLATADLLALEQFPQDPGHSLAQMSPRLRQILNAFFQTIYLGDIGPYRAPNQRTALTRQTIDHRAAGNGELVGQFVQRLTQQICTQARVSSVTDEGDGVRVVFAHGDTPGDQPAQTVSNKTVSNKTVFSKSVIVTAPAPITQQLLHTINEPCRSFLQAMRYAPATVVVIGVHGPDLADFSYLATPEGPTAVVMRHRTADPHTNVLFAYFTEDQATALCTLPTEQVVELAVETLTQLSIGLNRGDPLLFTDVQHWTHAAPVITPGIYDQWDARNTRPSPRVFLAGDYVHLDPRKPLPYGMNAAMGSGKAAAQAVRGFLALNTPNPPTKQQETAHVNCLEREHTMTYSLSNDDITVSSGQAASKTAVRTPQQSPLSP